MADEIITNGVLLQHIQAIHGEMLTMNNGLQQQINGLGQQIVGLRLEMNQRFFEVNQKLEEARQHRQALQEDLDATIRMVGKHQVKLAKIS